ncbi:MAG: carbohydrate ABC transporter permease [Chloroflexota bacterium]|nr:carbohydrate ABC transporter permease [Chloroflexota bacterium]
MISKALTGSQTDAAQATIVGDQPHWYTRAPLHIVVVVISVIWLVPTVSLLFTSVRSIQDINSSIWWTILIKPHQFTLENYHGVLQAAGSIGMGQAFLNSVFITVPATIFPIVIGAWAAYAFAWLRFPLRNTIFLMMVALQVIPLQMLLIPLLRLFTQWGINGTYPALWIAHTAFGLPLAIYIMRNFMSGIPYDLLESGRIDGAGEVRIFYSIILPLATPAIAAMAIFQFMWVWNDLLLALVFSGPTTAPMTVIVRTLVGEFGGGWQFMTSAAFISMALPLVIFFSLQRYFVAGLTAGSVKG